VVTGGAGFIGSNLVHALEARGADVLVVDDVDHPAKRDNLAGARVAEHLDKGTFRTRIREGGVGLPPIEAVLHQGACSSTLVDDEAYVLDNNTACSIELIDHCRSRGIPVVYASSAAVYGAGPRFDTTATDEQPLNLYARSKLLVDQHVRREVAPGGSQVVGLRYFNVYGAREDHKGRMASVVTRFSDQARQQGRIEVFATEGAVASDVADHRRDFVWVDDVVEVILWFLAHPAVSGIFNCGTGTARGFLEVADLVARAHHGAVVERIAFPPELHGRYQGFTQADLTGLRAAGCDHRFRPIETGVPAAIEVRSALGTRDTQD
jgi:ADP-L-glycero-D-manno-heptose 6-epimerase